MNKLPTKRQILNARQITPWDYGNEILYNLCRDNFSHDKDDRILTKALFIGRIYAAAIERRRNKSKDINDNFYTNKVVPTFRKSNLDKHFFKLKKIKKLSADNIAQVLETHHYLTATIYNITKLDKRSFASKYLHFHFPDLFFIYDSRAVIALRQFTSQVPKDLQYMTASHSVDKIRT